MQRRELGLYGLLEANVSSSTPELAHSVAAELCAAFASTRDLTRSFERARLCLSARAAASHEANGTCSLAAVACASAGRVEVGQVGSHAIFTLQLGGVRRLAVAGARARPPVQADQSVLGWSPELWQLRLQAGDRVVLVNGAIAATLGGPERAALIRAPLERIVDGLLDRAPADQRGAALVVHAEDD